MPAAFLPPPLVRWVTVKTANSVCVLDTVELHAAGGARESMVTQERLLTRHSFVSLLRPFATPALFRNLRVPSDSPPVFPPLVPSRGVGYCPLGGRVCLPSIHVHKDTPTRTFGSLPSTLIGRSRFLGA